MQAILDGLNAISVEARKKFPKVKEAAERALLLKKSEATWNTIALVLETREEKLVLLGLSLLQQQQRISTAPEVKKKKKKLFLILLFFVQGTAARLHEAVRGASEAVQLRVLQTLVALLLAEGENNSNNSNNSTSNNSNNNNNNASSSLSSSPSSSLSSSSSSEGEILAGLSLCSLLAGPLACSPPVASVGQAALRQSVQLLCSAHPVIASKLLRELCATACGDPPLTLQVDCVTAMELVESMADTDTVVVCPMLHRLLGVEKSLRGQRALLRLILRVSQSGQHAETEVLLVKCCRMLGEAPEGSSQLLLLELVHAVVAVPGMLASMFERCDSTIVASANEAGRTGLAATIVRALAKACGLVWRWSPEDLSDAACAQVGRLLDGGSGAPVSRGRLGRVMVAALESVSDALRDAPVRVRGGLLAVSWPSLLGALGLLLSKATNGTLVSSLCVDTLVSLIATCASVGETAAAPRDALVNAMVKCADEEGAAERQVVCTLGLLRASRAAQGLGAASWYAVLGLLLRVMRKRPEEELDPLDETLASQISAKLAKNNNNTSNNNIINSSSSSPPPEQLDDSEQGRLVQQVRRLACDSTHLAAPERSTFVAALCKLSQSTLHTATTPPSSSSAARMWPLDRLCETLLWNQSEAPLWDDVSGHLATTATQHTLPMVRERACSAIVALCGHASGRAPVQASALLGALCCATYAEVRQAGLRGLERMLRQGVVNDPEAWSAVLSGLGSVASLGKRDEVAQAYRLAQLVVEELLPSLPPPLLDVLCGHVLLPFAAQTADSSASLSVPTLVWSVAHHIATERLVNHWAPLLRLLASSARDEREEVRSGALRTLFKMPEMHAWPAEVTEDYLLHVLSPLLLELGRLATLRGQPPSEAWLSTAALAVAGVTDQRLDGAVASLLGSLLTAPGIPNNMAASAKSFRTSVSQLCTALAALLTRTTSSSTDVWTKVAMPALSLMLSRALSEAADLAAAAGASNTNSGRFANYFVLVDAVKILSAAPDFAAFLCLLLRDGAPALFEEYYKSAAILYDPVNFRSGAPAPLVVAVLAALSSARHRSPALAAVACALALAGTAGLVLEGPPVLLLRSDALPFPTFPADPPLPFVLRPALLPLARAVLSLLTSDSSNAPPTSAFPVLCCVLGVCVRTAELCELSLAAFAAVMPVSFPGSGSPELQTAVDLCHAALMWEGLPSSLASKCATLLARPPLLSPAALQALSSVASPPAAAALLLSDAPEAQEHALRLSASLLRSLHPSLSLLAKALLLRPGVSHLLVLFDDLVFAAANAPDLEARQSVAECLLLVGKEIQRLKK